MKSIYSCTAGLRMNAVVKNSILSFTIVRYCTYFLMFLRVIFVARYLGIYFYGIYGFLSMMQQYLSYCSLGVQHAISVQLATQDNIGSQKTYISSAVMLMSCIAVFIITAGVGIQEFNIPIFDKYLFNNYSSTVGVIAGLNLITQVLINIYRVYGKVTKIATVEFINASILLLIVFIFKDDKLIHALLTGMVLSGIISIIIYLNNAPFKLSFNVNLNNTKNLIKLGIPLLIYNISFYFIVFSGQTAVSIFYSVKSLGYYNMANSLTVSILLGLNSIMWVFFPEILSKMKEGVDNRQVIERVKKLNILYETSVFIIVFTAILMTPLIFWFLPQFKPMFKILNILLLSQTVFSFCYGYNCVAISQKKQMVVAKISMVAVAVVILFCAIVVSLKLDFMWISTSVLAGAAVFTILQSKYSYKLIMVNSEQSANIFSIGNTLPVVLCFAGSVMGYAYMGGLIGMIAYVSLNKNNVLQLWNFFIQKTAANKFITSNLLKAD